MDLTDLSAVTGTDDARAKFIDRVCADLELDFASYAAISPVSGAVKGYANYPQAWKDHYTRNRFHLVDPTLAMSARSIAPVDWSRFRTDQSFGQVFNPAGDFGIPTQGLTVPVRGPYGDIGLFSVSRRGSQAEWDLLKRKIMGSLQTSAVHLHDAVMNDDTLMRALRAPQLSSRETEILQWVAAGKSQQDIGDILAISHRTVEVHLRSAREKLGALTTPQAIGRAVRMGIIRSE